MRAGSVFSGIGGGDLGMEAAGIETAFQIENGKFPRRVLAARWPEVPKHGDVTKVDPGCLPAVDVLHGGFPCQDLSVAGRRAGLAGERSGLFHEFRRLAAALRPRWLVIENVPGLRSSQSGRDMGTVLGELAELGYGWAYRSLDAQYFGLAQRRERVFIVGCLGDGARAAKVLFEPDSGAWDSAPSRETGQDVAHALTGHAAKGGDPSTDNYVVMVQDAREVAKEQNGVGIMEADGPMYTLDGVSHHAVGIGCGVRDLTPLEAERLQGFSDGWTCLCDARGVTALCTCPDTPRYKALGNAIPVPVFAWIARRIVEATP